MLKLHPKFLEQDGKKAFAVLPYEEFLQVQEALDDFEDLKLLRKAKAEEGDAPTVSLAEARKQLA